MVMRTDDEKKPMYNVHCHLSGFSLKIQLKRAKGLKCATDSNVFLRYEFVRSAPVLMTA